MPEKVGEMPREYVGEDPQADGSITVRWGRDDSTVQMSVAGPVGWREPYVAVDAAHVRTLDVDNGLDWHFTVRHRREINRLIRLLRTARDQAFGKDE